MLHYDCSLTLTKANDIPLSDIGIGMVTMQTVDTNNNPNGFVTFAKLTNKHSGEFIQQFAAYGSNEALTHKDCCAQLELWLSLSPIGVKAVEQV